MTKLDVRKRRLSTGDDKTNNANSSRRKHSATSASGGLPRSLKISFLCLVISVVLLLVGFGLYIDTTSPFLVQLASKLGYNKNQYAVIIDAGSTGSRVLAYKFDRSFIDNKLVLSDELFKERKPGLSSFADAPEKGAHSIKLLLDEARAFIPKDKWSSTPLVLKATAGLRLLPHSKAENILNAVRDLFTKSEFSVEMDAVEIMDGTDEGIFSWFTVNFLLGRLSKTNQAAALDLGGGSTQVTFSPTDPEQVPVYEKYMHEVNTLNKKINVFTHSYLGLGLMAARHAVFTKGHGNGETNIASVCVNPIISNRTWIYGNVAYQISGKDHPKSTQENPIVDFDVCLDLIKSKVMPLVKPKPFTLKQHTIAAFSYYFERATESGLIDPFAGGEITVEAFRKKAQEVCAIPNDEQPFMCFDLTFISVLLHEGFGLGEGKKIKKGAHSIKLLLDEARAFIPKDKWSSTPLVLKATAGLRLLPHSKAENILNAVRDLFTKSEFSVEMDAVEIMDGTDEGIFSWFTVNFLLGRLSKTNQAAALDLGGGSTQVTFSPTDPEQVPVYEKYMHEVNTLNKKINVFTHSYLGLGLMAARHAVFTKGHGNGETNIASVCVNPIISNRTWIYGNVAYQISGKDHPKSTQENPIVDFDVCLDLIKSKVMPLVKPKPFTLKQHTIAAFSYYFERATESGLIDPFAGGEITVEAFRKKAQEVCAIPNDEQPFMCFDLTFISVLLHEGFGLGEGKKIKLYKKIDGHEISWALGCAYNVLTSDDKYNS